jgi:hypothetical protein
LQNSKITLAKLSSKYQFDLFFDEFLVGCKIIVKKNGDRGQSVENLMKLGWTLGQSPTGYVLVAVQEKKLVGFFIANCIPDKNVAWIEIIALWGRPGIFKKVQKPALEHFEKWAKSMTAKSMFAGIIRSPEKFYQKFYKPLGFKKIGYIVERKVS